MRTNIIGISNGVRIEVMRPDLSFLDKFFKLRCLTDLLGDKNPYKPTTNKVSQHMAAYNILSKAKVLKSEVNFATNSRGFVTFMKYMTADRWKGEYCETREENKDADWWVSFGLHIKTEAEVEIDGGSDKRILHIEPEICGQLKHDPDFEATIGYKILTHKWLMHNRTYILI